MMHLGVIIHNWITVICSLSGVYRFFVLLLAVNRSTNISSTKDNSETICANIPMFFKYDSLADGEGEVIEILHF